MKEKPILFSTPMVQAILEDRKTMTRRIIPNTLSSAEFKGFYVDSQANDVARFISTTEGFEFYRNPRYASGDILWVRETWCNINKPGIEPDYYFLADAVQAEDYDRSEWKWKPSIHMPRKAARVFLRVTKVRAERLQDIAEEDAKAEGVKAYGPNNCSGTSARIAFAELWDSLNEKRGYGWRLNHWVWVYTFERCEKPGGTE